MKHQANVLTKIETIDTLSGTDLTDLCDATESTITDNALSFSIGFNRTEPLVRERLENYWKGVLLVPERTLIIGRVDGVIAASLQLVKPSPSNQTSAFCGFIENHFVAPWARGHGLARKLLAAAEDEAIDSNLTVLRLSVRANLISAITLYEQADYICWGQLDAYEEVEDQMLSGNFYYKKLSRASK